MALLRTYVASEALGMSTSFSVVLPRPVAGAPEPKVLYLLHGLSDDDTTWVRRSSVERYAEDAGIAVVMPRVERSMYQDMAHGERYWTFVSEELPELVSGMFRVSTRRADTFVAGLSMGGYGAMRLALAQPERFAAGASLSGVLDVAAPQVRGERPELVANTFGAGEIAGSPSDLHELLRRADPAQLPRLMVTCGKQDELWPMQEPFVALARERGADVTTRFGPGGHEWGYWDAAIQDVLAWLPLGSPATADPAETETDPVVS